MEGDNLAVYENGDRYCKTCRQIYRGKVRDKVNPNRKKKGLYKSFINDIIE